MRKKERNAAQRLRAQPNETRLTPIKSARAESQTKSKTTSMPFNAVAEMRRMNEAAAFAGLSGLAMMQAHNTACVCFMPLIQTLFPLRLPRLP
jgi:hypothetical protein